MRHTPPLIFTLGSGLLGTVIDQLDGEWLPALIAQVAAENPDIVFLLGDLVAGRYEVGEMTALVSRGAGTRGPRMRLWRPGEILRVVLRVGDPATGALQPPRLPPRPRQSQTGAVRWTAAHCMCMAISGLDEGN